MIKLEKRSPDSLIVKLSYKKTFYGTYGRTGASIQSKLWSSNTRACAMQNMLFLYWKVVEKKQQSLLPYCLVICTLLFLFVPVHRYAEFVPAGWD